MDLTRLSIDEFLDWIRATASGEQWSLRKKELFDISKIISAEEANCLFTDISVPPTPSIENKVLFRALCLSDPSCRNRGRIPGQINGTYTYSLFIDTYEKAR